MVSKGLLIRLHAKPGNESAVARFLTSAMASVEEEPATVALFMVEFGPGEFGIVNAFPDEAGRQAHMTGHAAEALFAQADELFSSPPAVELLDILAAKLPG